MIIARPAPLSPEGERGLGGEGPMGVTAFAWRYVALLLLALGVNNSPIHAQSRARLEKQRRDNERRIRETNRILGDVSKKREATLGQLSALTQRIEGQTQLISTTSSELGLIESELADK